MSQHGARRYTAHECKRSAHRDGVDDPGFANDPMEKPLLVYGTTIERAWCGEETPYSSIECAQVERNPDDEVHCIDVMFQGRNLVVISGEDNADIGDPEDGKAAFKEGERIESIGYHVDAFGSPHEAHDPEFSLVDAHCYDDHCEGGRKCEEVR